MSLRAMVNIVPLLSYSPLATLYAPRSTLYALDIKRKNDTTGARLTFHIGNVLHATPHVPMNHPLSNPPGPSASEGSDDPGSCIRVEVEAEAIVCEVGQ